MDNCPKLNARALRGFVEISVETPITVTVPLTETDIKAWLNTIESPETLKHIARYANYCRRSLEEPPDDFQSHA